MTSTIKPEVHYGAYYSARNIYKDTLCVQNDKTFCAHIDV